MRLLESGGKYVVCRPVSRLIHVVTLGDYFVIVGVMLQQS